ncbi:hypothetical protein [Jannaschia pohangensis]|uniref:hypothetical protein n=1 Tax=Jannaschia pohangensis TaxID=390807 RepID=UPI001113979C|nr:hypothetical protein [Jannaschia pohangensis]
MKAADNAIGGIQQAIDAIARNQTRGRSWAELIPNRRDVLDFQAQARAGNVTKVHAKVELDMQGQPVGEIVTARW